MPSSVLSSPLHPPYKPLNPFSHCLQTPRNPILIHGFSPMRVRVSHQRYMTEFPRLASSWGSGSPEMDRSQESEAVPRIWSALRGVESALNGMSRWLLAGLFILAILWKHDAEVLWASAGSVVNSLLSTSLKHILNHERPVSGLKSDPGMPSSHAQSIFYLALFAILSLIHWSGCNVFTIIVGTLILISGSYLSWLRVSQRFHTGNQVLVGSALGATCGLTWYWLWHSLVQSALVSSVLVRVVVVLGSASMCLGFLIHLIQHRVMDKL